MALSSTRAIYNTAVDTLMAAAEVMIEAEPGEEGGQLIFVAAETMRGDHATDSNWGSDANALFDGVKGIRYYLDMKGWHATAADVPLKIGRHPMWWKLTNAAGDVT